jgi:hypothetical protein
MTKSQDRAEQFFEKHAGEKLAPPIGKERVGQLGKWQGGH